MNINGKFYDGIVGKPDIDELLEHHGVMGMKWGVRRYQNADGSLTSAGEKRYHVEKGKFGKTKIVDQYGKKMKRRDRRYMERAMKKSLKNNDSAEYKEYKKAKIKSNVSRTYKGSETLLSKAINRKGKAKVNEMLANYSNKYLSDLSKIQPIEKKKKRSKS